MPRGLRDLSVYCLSYGIQYWAYLLLVTDRYPDSDPLTKSYGPDPAPDHPIRISEDAELRRSRLTVFFRFLLFLPHYVWLALWGIAVLFTVIAQWFVTLFAGRPADALHRFNGAYVRYTTQVYSYLFLVTNEFPGFVGAPGSYPVDLHIAPPERQNRWKTGFRLILAFPALIVTSGVARSAARRRHLRLVRGAVPRPDAGWAAEPRRLCPPLFGSGERVPMAAHGPLSVQRAVARAAAA